MKILVYGAGVLGSFYAAQLQGAGHDVSLLARGQRLADLKEYGVVLREAGTGKQSTTQLEVVTQLAPEDAYDLVVVIVRKNQLASVLPALAKNAHTPNVLFMLNNAAGPAPLIDALGEARVILGFPVAGGWREEHTVYYLVLPNWAQRLQPVVFGELSGSMSPRLGRIMAAFREAGFYTARVADMDAWLKTHAAFDVPVVAAAHAVGGDVKRLARTRDALVLMARAVKEHFKVLRALGVPVTPGALRVLEWLPEPLLVALLRGFAKSEVAKIIGQHADDAPDETIQLADELGALSLEAAVPTPAADRLREHLNPDAPPISDGSARVPMDFRALRVVALTVTAGVLVVLGLSRRR